MNSDDIRQESEHIKYYKGVKYQLARDAWFLTDIREYTAETEFITLSADGWVHIKTWYVWDGASGPTRDTKSSIRGSLLHDALYQLLRLELLPADLRGAVDKELRKKCLDDDMWRWRANTWYTILGECGAPAAHPDHKRREYTAP